MYAQNKNTQSHNIIFSFRPVVVGYSRQNILFPLFKHTHTYTRQQMILQMHFVISHAMDTKMIRKQRMKR